MRQAQHPLPHGDVRQDAVHEAGCALGHAPASTARAESPPLAGERNEPFQRAVVSAELGEAAGEDATREEIAEFLLDEPRQPLPVRVMGGRLERRLEMLLDHAVARG